MGRISSESKLGSATGGDDECYPENGVGLMRILELHTHLEKIIENSVKKAEISLAKIRTH